MGGLCLLFVICLLGIVYDIHARFLISHKSYLRLHLNKGEVSLTLYLTQIKNII